MSSDEDPFAALQRARFVPLVSETELQQRSRSVRARLRSEARRERVAGLRRWWAAAVAGGVLAVATAGAVGANLAHRMPEQQDLVWCYRWVPAVLTDETARFAVMSTGAGGTTAQTALEQCYGNGDGTMGAIPDPVSQCVLHDGSLAVLPIARCSDIGLPESDLPSPPPG